ncbi:MAG: hypothetical protein V4717_23415 [Bacteroidota bacterium]
MRYRPTISLTLIGLILLFAATNNLTAQTAWTGTVSTDWNTAGNWSAGVPGAADDVTIPDTTNNPVISSAGITIRSLIIQAGGLLTVGAAGVLSINGSAAEGLFNKGTVQNNGIISIGNISNVAGEGIQNEAIFNNNSGAAIYIDSSSGEACLYNNGSFTNTGTITTGSNDGGTRGIYVKQGDFLNDAGGVINISNAYAAVEVDGGGILNYGNMNISSAYNGVILSFGVFTNSGQVKINGAFVGVICNIGSTTNNLGTMIMGEEKPVYTLVSTTDGFSGTFNNRGLFKASGEVKSNTFVNDHGTLSPGHPVGKLDFDNSESFTNSTLNMDVNGVGTAGEDYDQVVVFGTATLGGKLVISINKPAVDGDQVTLVKAIAIHGTFSMVTGLPPFWKLSYTPTSVILTYDLTNVWTGNAGPFWDMAGNWSHGTVPTAYTNVRIPGGTTNPCLVRSHAAASTIHVQGGTFNVFAGVNFTVIGRKNFNGVSAAFYNQGTAAIYGTLYIAN